jgi:hypothetical protein
MKTTLRTSFAAASCVLAAGLTLTGDGQATAGPDQIVVGDGDIAPNPDLARERCPDGYLCVYEEEEFFGELGKIKVSDPDMTDEPDRWVFTQRVESVINNSSCDAYLYSEKRFKEAKGFVPADEDFKDIENLSPLLKHHVYSAKFEC